MAKRSKTWLDYNAGADDRAILCGDVKHKYEMDDISNGNCHGPDISLCTGGSDCDNACYDCVGGVCN